MSNENRKSMDDVLASIRRIVRAEKQPEDADIADDQDDDGPMPQEVTNAGTDSPLELTPDMRMNEGGINPAAAAVVAPPMEAPDLDEDTLKSMVRDVIREELADGDMGGAIRDIIKDELTTGEIGGNISRNVLALIQSEVAKSIKESVRSSVYD